MAVFDELKDAISKGVNTVSAKSETLLEGGRAKSAVSYYEKQLSAARAVLGEKVYTAWKAGVLDLNALAAELEAVDKLEKEMEEYQEKLDKIKEAEGFKPAAKPEPRVCAGCGKPLPAGSKFCVECGKPVE